MRRPRVRVPSPAPSCWDKLDSAPQNRHPAPMRPTAFQWMGGDVDDGFGGVADVFRSNFEHRGEVGAAVAVYRDGHKVVDLWGGLRDPGRGLRWEADTLVPASDAPASPVGDAQPAEHDGASLRESEGARDEYVEHQSRGRAAFGVPLDERRRRSSRNRERLRHARDRWDGAGSCPLDPRRARSRRRG